MSVCVECGTKTILAVDHSDLFAIKSYKYPLCGKCSLDTRRWMCDLCNTVFLGKMSRFFSIKRPHCPQCGKKSDGHVSAVLIPADIRGKPEAAKCWRNSLGNDTAGSTSANGVPAKSEAESRFTEETKAARIFRADYLGGHPNAAQGEVVLLACLDAGVRVYSRKSFTVLFDMPWPSIARIQHIHIPKDKPITQGEMYLATYGASGRGGAITDWANAAIAIRGIFGRGKHIVSIVLRTDDGFEGAIGFEDKIGETIAAGLTTERLRHGQHAAPSPGTSAPASDDAVSKLKELGGLRDAGIITAEEFAAKKAELLARL
jgi:hypothetical protein